MLDLKAAIDALAALALRGADPKPPAFLTVPSDWKPGDPHILVAGSFTKIDNKRVVPKDLFLSTLQGVVDFVVTCTKPEDVLIQVTGPTSVVVAPRAPSAAWLDRPPLAVASCRPRVGEQDATGDGGGFELGEYYSVEDMIVALQSRFRSYGAEVALDDTTAVLSLISSVRGENVRGSEDSGFVQTVSARVGVGLKDGVPIANPVRLAPYRTFPEVSQPISPFVLRARSGAGLPEFALFEADGGAWAHEAVNSIVDKLRSLLPKDLPAVLPILR